ncbi:Demethylspheroidene O-methyltransferase [Anaerohalosphaera lusitana]|uniref:Demethylspheroidene O-methyltransferase n=1 Tax=Anaerohalosphaera lusitana TaxID=1936003 RepID=A0A1U9NN33_9BACT|nr:methyltransferase [Anaerohalosphaera lusitana]AQT69352.1 Demethylspheroidene O-methyltransferase [Anaerohalosphaera lusitana]
MDKGFTYIHELIWGYRTARTLELAVKADIFTAMADGPANLDHICRKCGTKPDMTRKLLTGCQALDLVTESDGEFANTDLAAKYLLPASPYYQGNIIAHAFSVQEYWNSLENELFQQPPAPPTEQARHYHFIMGMDNIARGGRADLFLNSVDLTGRENMLDVGGGPGSYSIAACKKYTKLKSTVFDLPQTTEIAEKVITRENMTDRITTQPGDWNEDEFGSGYDVVLFSNVLHGPNSGAEMKLAKAHRAMQPGALLAIQEFVMNDEDAKPVPAAMFNIMVGAYKLYELMEVIADAGFTGVQVAGSNDEIGCMWITAARQ